MSPALRGSGLYCDERIEIEKNLMQTVHAGGLSITLKRKKHFLNFWEVG